jgi:hypothetical protein
MFLSLLPYLTVNTHILVFGKDCVTFEVFKAYHDVILVNGSPAMFPTEVSSDDTTEWVTAIGGEF